MFLGLTKLENLFTRINLVENSDIKANGTQPLAEGIYNIITKFPIFGRLLYSFRLYDYNYNISSPFRSFYNGVIKNKMNIYPLTKISKFTRIDLFTKVEKRVELIYSYKGNAINLESLLKNNSLYLRNLISNFVSNYSNITCKINLICSDQIVSINTIFKNGHIEEFNLNRTNINFVNKMDKKAESNLNFLNSLLKTQCSKNSFDLSPKNKDSFDLCPKNIDSFYDPSVDRTRELLHLTDPMNNFYDLQVLMQKGFSNYEYNFQKGESSTSILHPSNSNRGTKRPLEDENIYSDQMIKRSEKYPCLDIKMVELQSKNYLYLEFDPEKLNGDRDSYLDEICTIGRTVLMEHYSKLVENISTVRQIVDNVKFDDISISSNIDRGYIKFYDAFREKNLDIINSHGIDLAQIYPFSKLYFDGNLDYSEDDFDYDDYSDFSTQKGQQGLNNFSSKEINYLDNSVSLGDSTQKGQEVLNNFSSKEINHLIKWLRSKQIEYQNKKNVFDPLLLFKLKDTGLTYLQGVFSEEGGENEITKLLTKLISVKPDLFPRPDLYPRSKQVVQVSVNSLCSDLRVITPLNPEKVINELTEENIIIFTEEIKSRIQKLYLHRKSKTHSQTYTFDDLNIIHIHKAVVELPNFKENDFTEFVRFLIEKKPEFFLSQKGKEVYLRNTSVKNLYHSLNESIRKPLTCDEASIIVQELEIRKSDLIQHRNSVGIKSKIFILNDIYIAKDDILLNLEHDLQNYEATRLLESFFIEKQKDLNIKGNIYKSSIDNLIRKIKTFYLIYT
jgi:hypothetical protein